MQDETSRPATGTGAAAAAAAAPVSMTSDVGVGLGVELAKGGVGLNLGVQICQVTFERFHSLKKKAIRSIKSLMTISGKGSRNLRNKHI